MFNGLHHDDHNLCDKCASPQLCKVADSLQDEVVIVNGRWTDDKFTTHKAKVWSKALDKANKQLKKQCVTLYSDYEQITLCENCLEEILASMREHKRD